MTTDGGGWTVFQRRMDGSVNFTKGWYDYKVGFGNFSTEFWLGNDALYDITQNGSYKLRVDMETFSGTKLYATYSTFNAGNESSGYVLTVGGYSGNAGDSLTYHNGMKFSTMDKDQDLTNRNCALTRNAFWHNECVKTTPNGPYRKSGNYVMSEKNWGITWVTYKNTYNISMKKFSMMIKRV